MDATTRTAEEHFRRGCEALDAEAHAEALEQLRTAAKLEPTRALYRSFYGLALGVAERRFESALELCREAAREEFFNPVFYHNLARLHLVFGFKAEAVRYLRRGLMIDPRSAEIRSAMLQVGVRRRPPIAFLRRRHPVNRWIGNLLYRMRIDPEPAELSAFGL